jgi:hypothetical protein
MTKTPLIHTVLPKSDRTVIAESFMFNIHTLDRVAFARKVFPNKHYSEITESDKEHIFIQFSEMRLHKGEEVDKSYPKEFIEYYGLGYTKE